MKRLPASDEGTGEIGNRCGVDQVHGRNFHPLDTRQRGFGPFKVARRHDHLCARTGERFCRNKAEAGIAAGDNGGAAGKVEASDYIASGGGGAEGRSDGFLQARHEPISEVRRTDDRPSFIRNYVVIVQEAPADPLSDVLGLVQASAACTVCFTAGGAWALRFSPTQVKFNVIRSGSCWILAEGSARRLSAGDCFMVAGTPFVLASDPTLQPIDASLAFEDDATRGQVGAAAETEILGGSVSFDDAQADLLLPLLPGLLLINAEQVSATPMGWLIAQLDAEWRSNLPGARAACDDMIRLLFVQALRSLLGARTEIPSWLGGLSDPPVSRALHAIHANPARHWRLDELASLAGLSRSTFAERFARRVGMPPVSYATIWRMRVAARQLAASTMTVSAVAAQAGYLSDSAFHAAFRREIGVSPVAYRRKLRRS
ncbi:MAG: AraC family transcriptional regulator [Novosphingobium pentaromativorans]|uniref:AraC family transcriptional regulator n=1 Tax=Novosphingobium pentaromativorans TaxID=205844 RepID=A0A2W5NH01_9SPHN|nr:MAG: AraC family transcriptional regulator [Novosphingobium pentaromativorans]